MLVGGLKCIACSQIINYNQKVEGKEFDDENLRRSFRNTRISILCYLDSENHKKSHCLLTKRRNEEREVTKRWKECCINCVGVAYTTLFFSESSKSYEHHIADVYNCGGMTGTKK